MIYRTTLLLGFLVFVSFTLKSQTSFPDPAVTPVILAHYDSLTLADIQATDSVKYNTIIYYYTKSFHVESIDCVDCVPADLSNFDVSKYEQFRERSTEFVRVYKKYGYQLTLLSIDEMLYTLPIHSVHP